MSDLAQPTSVPTMNTDQRNNGNRGENEEVGVWKIQEFQNVGNINKMEVSDCGS